MSYVPLWIFLLAAGGIMNGLPSNHRFILQPESRIWIEGSTSVNTFTCVADEANGFLLHAGNLPTSHADAPQASQAVLTLLVRSFSCGDRRIDRDFYRALKAGDSPEIQYELLEVEVVDPPSDSDETHEVRAAGRLTVAGTSRRIDTLVRGLRLPDGRLRATGVQKLMMTDFGIERPSALWGLIKARDHLLIRFDLIAAPEDGTPAAEFDR